MDKMVDKIFNNFFRGKKVFITGHTGFKGSWLTFLLYHLGAKVVGYSLANNDENSSFNLLNIKDLIDHHEGDVRDFKNLKKTFHKSKAELVFHLAAQSLVKKSYDEPHNTHATNIIGSLNILELVKMSNHVRTLIYVTSDKCYENKEWIWGYRESDELGGHDPYSASKAAAEIIFSSYNRSYFLKNKLLGAASVRAGNVIGGGDWSENRIVPDCIRSVIDKKTIYLRSPDATRPWQHVLEPLSGYLLLTTKLFSNPNAYSGSWNFGPNSNETFSVLKLANYIIKFFGSGKIKILDHKNTHHHETELLKLNCDKANIFLNWFPKWDISKTLEMTASWYKNVLEGKKARDVTLKQIKDFFS